MKITDLIKNNSVRILIVLIIFIQILVFTVVTGYLAYTSGFRTIKENAAQISILVNNEISKTLTYYLDEPLQLEQFHKNVILNNQLDFANQVQRDKHFVESLKIFPGVTNTYVGLSNGYEYGARREDDGSFVVWESRFERGTLDYYRYDSPSGRQGYINSLTAYDPRERPPYLRGVELKKPGWTKVYPSATGRGLVVTAVHPVYGLQNEMVGVLGSSLLLNWVDEFLRSLSVTAHSSIFIIDRGGNLIASTDGSTHRRGNVNDLINNIDYQSTVLSQTVKALRESKQSIDSIHTDVSLNFQFLHENYIVQVHPVSGNHDLDWLSVLIIPEHDLTQGMNDFTKQLLFVMLIACSMGLLTGVASARYIINPVIGVNRRAKAIADGDYSSMLATDRQDEIGQLIIAMNEMSKQLAQNFDNLRENQLRIKLLTTGIETSSNLIVILDANQLIWWVNAAFEKLLGYTSEEIRGQWIREILSEQNDYQVILHIQESLNEQREWRGEIIARSKDGRNFVDEILITPILDDAGNTSYYLAIGRDITEKVKVREAFMEAQKALIKAEKMYLMGTMASGISHEINQPLSSIKVITGGLLYMLRQENTLSNEEYREHLGEINKQIDRVAGIIKHLRSFIRDEQRNLIPCDINSIMEEVLNIVGFQLKVNGIRVSKDLQFNLPNVMAHPIGLEQIGVNLVTNAIEALSKADVPEKKIIIRTRFDKQVILEIGNNGPAILPELQETIFQPFITSKNFGENQGFGLALVHSTLNLYSGKIALVQSNTEGVLFRISLPEKADEDPRGIPGESMVRK